jgi:exodeoxyribonuclease-3
MAFKAATWNVNSIKVRMPIVLDWLAANQPDVLLLQEIKTLDFPEMEFTGLGYRTAFIGQKSYNGVALLSKHPIEDVITALPGDPEDDHSRYIEATVAGYRVASIYLPNGNPVGTEKFPYKLAWMQRLRSHMADLLELDIPVVLGGDYNVIPEPQDCYNPRAWEGDALYQPETRAAWRSLLNLGYTDAFRALNESAHCYSFWDYQAGRWQRDEGIRIDHFLLSPQAADLLQDCTIDREPRGRTQPSDHTPVIVTLG